VHDLLGNKALASHFAAQCRHITIGVIHGAPSPIVGAPTQEQLATAMGHSPSTARMHYDRAKPQRDAQRAVNGMAHMREAIKAKLPSGLPRVEEEDVGVDVGGEVGEEMVVGGDEVVEVEEEEEYEYDIEIDLDEE
jgi:hypothetical protein